MTGDGLIDADGPGLVMCSGAHLIARAPIGFPCSDMAHALIDHDGLGLVVQQGSASSSMHRLALRGRD